MILMMIGRWKTMGKYSKLVSRANLRRSQRNSSTMMNTMKGDLPSMIQNIVHGTSSVD
jgi:hypothetical protein